MKWKKKKKIKMKMKELKRGKDGNDKIDNRVRCVSAPK